MSATPSRSTRSGTPTALASTSAGRGALIRPAARALTVQPCPFRTWPGSDPGHGWKGRLLVPRHEQRPRLWNPRPRGDLHDCDDGARAGRGAHLAQPVAEARAQLVAGRPDELELLADGSGELDRLQAQLDDGGGDLEQLRPERRAEARTVGRRLA